MSLNSSRKWDTHGDWHVFRDLARMALALLVSRTRFRTHVQRYWYDDRSR